MTALHLLGRPEALPRDEILSFVFSCLHESGGFGAAPGHDAHMLYTCSAVQIIATLDAFDELEVHMKDGRRKIGECMFIVTCDSSSMFHTHTVQGLPSSRTRRRALLPATSGERKIQDSCSMHSWPSL